MSIFFYCDGKEVWNPPHDVGKIFVGQIGVVEKNYGLCSGFTANLADEVEINKVEVRLFLGALCEILRKTGSSCLIGLIQGVFSVVAGLNGKIGNGDSIAEQFPELLEQGKRWVDYFGSSEKGG